jgi:diacylglycerol kinase family enzyme
VLVQLIHHSDAGEQSLSAESVTELVARSGHRVRYLSASTPDWAESIDASVDVIAIAGGDGTVSEVFQRAVGVGPPFAILPVGHANNIATSLGMNGELASLPAQWDIERQRSFDLLEMSASDPSGRPRLACESVGCGVLVDVLRGAPVIADGDETLDHARHRFQDRLRRARPMTLTIDADGERTTDDYLAVEVMNIDRAGPGVTLAPRADPGDGEVDLVAIRASERELLAAHLARLRWGIDEPKFRVRRARSVTVRAERSSLGVRADDELLGPVTWFGARVGPQVRVLVGRTG